jgi:hypothetical protein
MTYREEYKSDKTNQKKKNALEDDERTFPVRLCTTWRVTVTVAVLFMKPTLVTIPLSCIGPRLASVGSIVADLERWNRLDEVDTAGRGRVGVQRVRQARGRT